MTDSSARHDTVEAERLCKCCHRPAGYFGSVDFAKCCEDRRQAPLPRTGIAVHYYRCGSCGFIFTAYFDDYTHADFARDIYNEDYIRVDPDFVDLRPRNSAGLVRKFFGDFRRELSILDFGAGEGRMSKILNEEEFSVENYDPFAGTDNRLPDRKYDLVTCFEVMEHTPDPRHICGLLRGLVKDTGMIFFSTLLQPPTIETDRLRWWYIAPRNAHISIYTRECLERLWAEHRFHVGSFNEDLHVAFQQVPSFAQHLVRP